ncbi:MAG: imidazole glycerol phosphate synthase subunit HisH [Planctomycetota bacterium]
MIQIINTGVANIRSLQASFDRLNQPWNLTESADDVREATHVVLPGVGAIAAAAESLDQLGLRDALRQRIADSDRSTLCICLGMQLLFDASEESDSARGLGIIPLTVKRFPDDLPVPQLGWNSVKLKRPDASGTSRFDDGEAYFANSFRLVDAPPDDWGFAETDYGGHFVSSLWRGHTLACQFHPELSGSWGEQLLRNWVMRVTLPQKTLPTSLSEESSC